MTNEEAKEILDHNWTKLVNPDYSDEELGEAQNLAIKALSEPTIPLSVIEKIKAEIDNDRLCYAEELQKPLKKKHTLYELKEYTARQELLSIKCAICQDILDIIDKAVKECTHETN